MVKNAFALAIGFVSGFFGSGGGLLCVPALEKLCGLGARRAHATTIAIILPISVISLVIYMTHNPINYISVGLVTLGVIVGGFLGAMLLKKLNERVINWIFIVVLLLAGVRMVVWLIIYCKL